MQPIPRERLWSKLKERKSLCWEKILITASHMEHSLLSYEECVQLSVSNYTTKQKPNCPSISWICTNE